MKMSIYGQPPEGLVIGHRHIFQHASGTAYVFDNVQPAYMDLSRVRCGYCGREYLVLQIKQEAIFECLGCGASKFSFRVVEDGMF